MSTYDPFGWSSTLAAARSTVDASKTKKSYLKVILPWLVMRLVLGFVISVLFELTGAFILSQTDYSGYDFRTHRRARAIIAIGGFGGLAIGLVLLVIDFGLSRVKAYAKDQSPIKACALRIVLWPGLGALGGVVGVQLWYLSQGARPNDHAGDRCVTGAIVQIVGAAVIVSAPSIIQMILLGLSLAGKSK